MADDNSFRSNPPVDPRWPGQAAPARATRAAGPERNDPLAELARLIGQTDPFGDIKPAAPRPSAPAQGRPAPMPAAAPRRPIEPRDPYGSPLQFDGRSVSAQQQDSFQPAYDPAIYGTAEHAPGHASDAYHEDPAHQAHGDEGYEQEYADERPRRGLLKLAVALVALAIIGGGGVFGYRVLYSGIPSGDPKVIKANTAPTKIVPAPASEASNKQIYDRVADGSPQGERVVSREEKPVDVKDNSRQVPRAVFPSGTANAQDTASPPLNTDPGGPDAAEPKKIRTVTIRPDGTGSTQGARPNATATTRGTAPPAGVSPAAASGNAPLSLSPQVASAEASARPAFPPPPRQPIAAPVSAEPPTRLAAMPPATEVAAGAYTVQISSQRSESEAQATFRSLQAKYPSLLGDRQPIIRRADLGDKGIYFRALVGPFASVDQATQFCGSLKSAGGQCVVARN